MKLSLKFLSKNWLQHVVFWILSLYVIGSYFSISNFLKVIDFIYAGFFHIPLFVLVYINLRYLIPSFFQKEKYFQFALLGAFSIALSYFLHELIYEIVIPLLPTDFYMVSFTDITVLITIFGIYWLITTLLKLSKSWYKLQKIEKEKLSLELNSLKMQINPHFLFNSLNSIYSMSLNKNKKTAEVILGLSNLLRYMIYEVSEESVLLEKEMEAIRHYIELQKTRAEPDTKITFSLTNNTSDKRIAPLLFFPIIENSFKHGLNGEKDQNFVHIRLENRLGELIFNVKNNIGKTDDLEKSAFGGVGLENVKKRLTLIYGNKSNMVVSRNNDIFEVNIKIQWE